MCPKTLDWRMIGRAVVLCLVATAAMADGKRLMTDAELDAVTAGTAATAKAGDLLKFDATKRTASGKTITADGSLQFVKSLQGINIGSLTLSDNAQNNLHSLININAVNSAVNVLLNLNISIDSSVGSIDQVNLGTPVPATPPLPGN